VGAFTHQLRCTLGLVSGINPSIKKLTKPLAIAMSALLIAGTAFVATAGPAGAQDCTPDSCNTVSAYAYSSAGAAAKLKWGSWGR